MNNTELDGFEIDQKVMESLNVGDRFNFSDGKYDSLPLYEAREKIVNDLYAKYKKVMVNSEDEVYGLQNGDFKYIKKAEGLYKALEALKI